MMNSVVLQEDIDPNYEPSEEEILEYAKWLGIDISNDRDLFWIAREGLKAPLPSQWKPCKTDDGEIYYFNFDSGESIWDHPMDDHYRKLFKDEKDKKEQRLRSGGGAQPQASSSGGSGGAKLSKLNPLGGLGPSPTNAMPQAKQHLTDRSLLNTKSNGMTSPSGPTGLPDPFSKSSDPLLRSGVSSSLEGLSSKAKGPVGGGRMNTLLSKLAESSDEEEEDSPSVLTPIGRTRDLLKSKTSSGLSSSGSDPLGLSKRLGASTSLLSNKERDKDNFLASSVSVSSRGSSPSSSGGPFDIAEIERKEKERVENEMKEKMKVWMKEREAEERAEKERYERESKGRREEWKRQLEEQEEKEKETIRTQKNRELDEWKAKIEAEHKDKMSQMQEIAASKDRMAQDVERQKAELAEKAEQELEAFERELEQKREKSRKECEAQEAKEREEYSRQMEAKRKQWTKEQEEEEERLRHEVEQKRSAKFKTLMEQIERETENLRESKAKEMEDRLKEEQHALETKMRAELEKKRTQLADMLAQEEQKFREEIETESRLRRAELEADIRRELESEKQTKKSELQRKMFEEINTNLDQELKRKREEMERKLLEEVEAERARRLTEIESERSKESNRALQEGSKSAQKMLEQELKAQKAKMEQALQLEMEAERQKRLEEIESERKRRMSSVQEQTEKMILDLEKRKEAELNRRLADMEHQVREETERKRAEFEEDMRRQEEEFLEQKRQREIELRKSNELLRSLDSAQFEDEAEKRKQELIAELHREEQLLQAKIDRVKDMQQKESEKQEQERMAIRQSAESLRREEAALREREREIEMQKKRIEIEMQQDLEQKRKDAQMEVQKRMLEEEERLRVQDHQLLDNRQQIPSARTISGAAQAAGSVPISASDFRSSAAIRASAQDVPRGFSSLSSLDMLSSSETDVLHPAPSFSALRKDQTQSAFHTATTENAQQGQRNERIPYSVTSPTRGSTKKGSGSVVSGSGRQSAGSSPQQARGASGGRSSKDGLPPRMLKSTDQRSSAELRREQQLAKLREENEQLKHEKRVLKKQKKSVKQKQEALENAREDWKKDMHSLAARKGHPDYQIKKDSLHQVKKVLEKQAKSLNDEVRRMQQEDQWVRLRLQKVAIMEEQAVRGEDAEFDGNISDASSETSTNFSEALISPSSFATTTDTSPGDGDGDLSDASSIVSSISSFTTLESPLARPPPPSLPRSSSARMSQQLSQHRRSSSRSSAVRSSTKDLLSGPSPSPNTKKLSSALEKIESELGQLTQAILMSQQIQAPRDSRFDQEDTEDEPYIPPQSHHHHHRRNRRYLPSSNSGPPIPPSYSHPMPVHPPPSTKVFGRQFDEEVARKWEGYLRNATQRLNSDQVEADATRGVQRKIVEWVQERDSTRNLLQKHSTWLKSFSNQIAPQASGRFSLGSNPNPRISDIGGSIAMDQGIISAGSGGAGGGSTTIPLTVPPGGLGLNLPGVGPNGQPLVLRLDGNKEFTITFRSRDPV